MKRLLLLGLCMATVVALGAPAWADEPPPFAPDPISIDPASPSLFFGNTMSDIYGEVIDRLAMPHGKSPALSAEILIAALCVLASAETCIISTIKIEHDTDSGFSTPTDFKVFTETLTVTDAVAGEKGELRLAVDLSAAKQFIRIELTPTMSAGVTDTADIFCSLAFGGFPVVPIA